jgi:hypothetical protein
MTLQWVLRSELTSCIWHPGMHKVDYVSEYTISKAWHWASKANHCVSLLSVISLSCILLQGKVSKYHCTPSLRKSLKWLSAHFLRCYDVCLKVISPTFISLTDKGPLKTSDHRFSVTMIQYFVACCTTAHVFFPAALYWCQILPWNILTSTIGRIAHFILADYNS